MNSKNLLWSDGKEYKEKCMDYIKNNNLKRIYFKYNLNLKEIAITIETSFILVYPQYMKGFEFQF